MGELSKNHCSDVPDLCKGKATVILNVCFYIKQVLIYNIHLSE